MIDAAVIGLGRWGKNIVEAVQGKSKRLRCYSRLPISVSPREIPRGDAARDECPHRFAVLPSLGFPVNRVLAAPAAELVELHAVGRVPL